MASVVPILDVPKLLESARFVALGRATSVGGQACIKVSFVVKPEENTPTGCLPLARLSDTVGTQGKFGFFFLKRGDGVGLAAVSEDHPFVVAAPPEYNRFPAQTGQLPVIAASVASVFTIPTDVAADQRIGLARIGMVVPPPTPDGAPAPDFSTWRPASRTRVAEEVYHDALDALRSIPYEVRRPFLAIVVETGSPSIGRAWATASMLQAGDYSDIQVDLPFLLHPPGDAVLTESLLSLAVEQGRYEVSGSAGPILLRLMQSTSPRIRKASLEVLMERHLPEYSAALAIALHDPDTAIRRRAIYKVCGKTASCDPNDPAAQDNPDGIARLSFSFSELNARPAR